MKYSNVYPKVEKLDYEGNSQEVLQTFELSPSNIAGMDVTVTKYLPSSADAVIMSRGFGSEKMTLTVHNTALRYLTDMFGSI